MSKRLVLATAAAAFFAAGGLVGVASAESAVKCSGINSCKGTSACKTGSSSCKGQNSCKGQGWSNAATPADCTAKGGKVL